MRPPFSYYGGKGVLARRIVELLPPHRSYIEPFFGSGAVLFAKAPSQHEVVNDIDGNVVNFFRVLRKRTDELVEACALTPHSRAEYAAASLEGELDELERARRFWVRVNQSFDHAAGGTAGWSVTTSRNGSVPATFAARLGRLAPAAERLMRVTIECADAVDVIERLANSDTAIYVDPPYLASTRRGGRCSNATDYGAEMCDAASHQRLAEALRATPAAVVLSGYPSQLYDELYAGWYRLDVSVVARSANAATSERGTRTEVLWCNRPLDDGRLPLVFGEAS